MSRRGGRSGVALAAALVVCGVAASAPGARAMPTAQTAREDVAALSAELRRLQEVVHDESAGEEARREAAARAHEVRARLIELAPMSLDTPTWLADQGADALAVAMADHDDLSVVFGVASPAEAARVRRAAEESSELLTRARRTAEDLVARLEAELFEEGTAEARVGAIERALGKLIDEELEARIPLLSAQASVLLAASGGGAGEGREGVARSREAARRVLEELADLRYQTAEAEAARLCLTGSALLSAARTGGADGADTQMRSRAREQFRAAAAKLGELSAGAAGTESDAVLRATVQLGLLRTGGPDPSRLAVEREALLEQGRALIAGWAGSPLEPVMREGVCAEMLAREAKDGAWVAQALEVLVEPVALGEEGAAGRARDVGAKIVAALGLGAPAAPAEGSGGSAAANPPTAAVRVEQLPAKAALTAAMALEGTNDVATLGQRLRLLRAAAREEASGKIDQATRVEALWRLAAALAQSERTAELIEGTEALAALIRAGRAGTERFESAVRAGPELGHFAVARAAAGGDASQVKAARGALARVLFAVLQREETGAMMTSAARNGARLELAGLLLSEAARGTDLDPAARAAVLEEVIWVLEGVNEGADGGGAGSVVRGAAEEMARAAAGARGLPKEQRLALTRRALAWGDEQRVPERMWLRLEHVRALLEAGDAGALRAIEPLAALEWSDAERAAAGGVSIAEIRLTLARAQRAAGDAAAAFATLRDLTTALDQPIAEEGEAAAEEGEASEGAGATARHPIFWEAWADMLEMLAAANADGSRTAEMRLHLNRLALIDEAFGGGEPGNRLRAVRERLGD